MKHTKLLAVSVLVLAFCAHSFASESRPVVSGIQALASGSNKITVSWILPAYSGGERIVRQKVYKSTRPFTNSGDINESLLLATLGYNDSSYTDTVSDYREYYYAVITLTAASDYPVQEEDLFYDEELDGSPYAEEDKAFEYLVILPGVNATVRGCRVQLPSRQVQVLQDEEQTTPLTQGEKRSLPLAYLELETESTPRRERTISDAAEKDALTLTKKNSGVKPFTEPYVFEEDLMMPPSGTEDYELFNILKTSFIRQDYKKAVSDLSAFILKAKNTDTLRRARFYLGQSYYFRGDYASAVTNFLCTETDMSPTVRKWTESALDLYQIP